MSELELTCPYCGEQMTIPTDGLYTPRYHVCDKCSEKFIYEPLKSRVATYKMGEAETCSDLELRAIELSGYDEQ